MNRGKNHIGTDTYGLNEESFGGYEFVGNERENPFARICCKSRRLTPTLCDGTCMDCRKSREEYLQSEPSKLITREILESGGDPEAPITTLEDAKKIVQKRIEQIEKQKKIFLNEKIELERRVDERLRYLQVKDGEIPYATLH